MAGELIIIVDRDLIIRNCSGDLEANAGLQEGDLSGKQLIELFEADSCRFLNSWWSKGPFERSDITLKPRCGPLFTYLSDKDWKLIPLKERERIEPDLIILSASPPATKEKPSGIERTISQMESFASVVLDSLSGSDDGDPFGKYVESIAELTGLPGVFIALFTEEAPHIRLVAKAGFTSDEITSLEKSLISKESLHKLRLKPDLKRGSMSFHLAAGLHKDSTRRIKAKKLQEGSAEGVLRESLVIPLQYGNQLFGYLAAFDWECGGSFSPELVKILELMTAQIVQAIVRKKMQIVAETRHKDLTLLHDISRLINSSYDTDEILSRLVSTIRDQMGYSHVSLLLLDGGELVLKTFAGKTPRKGYERIEVGSGIIGRAVFRGKPILVNNISHDPHYLPSVPGTRSKIAVPIKSSSSVEGLETESIIGVLNAESDIPNNFMAEDVSRLEAIANTAAMAIENSLLMSRVLSLLQAEANHSKELQHKKSELDEFINTISHDLKNPLNSIAGFAETLELELEQQQDPKIRRYLDRIRANVQVVSRMIGDLLELSRVGRVEEEMIPFSPENLIKEIRFDLSGSGEELKLDYIGLPETIVANRNRIRQLFTNLITNAIKYRHPDRPVEVNIEVRDLGEEFEFRISDNGLGIDEKHLKSIFIFGVRLRETKKVDGTGAGLAISRKIVESHGGRIWVESRKGIGSTFYFTLPKVLRS